VGLNFNAFMQAPGPSGPLGSPEPGSRVRVSRDRSMKPVRRILSQEGEVGFLQRSPPKGSR
jgi:hypothetical protein